MTAAVVTAIPYLISLCAVAGTFYGIQHTNRVNLRLQQERLRSDDRNEYRSIVRTKGEELYMLINDFKTDLSTSLSDILQTLLKEGKYQAVASGDIRASNSASLKIEMLTRVYFPDAVPQLEKLREHHGMILAEMLKITDCNTDTQCTKFVGTMMLLSTQTTDLTYQLQRAIVSDLQKLKPE